MDDEFLTIRDAPTQGQLVYDCTPWAGESRRLFAALLEGAGIQAAWQGTEVTVFAADRDAVDELVEQVRSTTTSAIDTDEPIIVYRVSDWPSALLTEFEDQLTISDVPYAWDADGNLVVDEADEDAVEEVLDMLPDPDSFADVDGLEAQDRLNDAFRLCDRLASRPADDAALGELRTLVGALGGMSPPFGFEQDQWVTLVEAVSGASTDERLSDRSRAKAAKAAKKLLLNYV